MRPLLPLVAAGGSFAAAAVIGLVVGVLIAQRSQQPLWALGGLMGGAAVGAACALGLLVKSMR